ncbi:hypothetical protein [Metallosphaera hakonensis]|nr:hypothetical protein [Metallosphaera hakonensis]
MPKLFHESLLPDVDVLSRKVARYYTRCAGFPTAMNGYGLRLPC